MQAVRFTLNQNSTGPDVANLHEALRRLGFGDIPATEIGAARYGDGTTEMVRLAQQELGVPADPPGVVDEITAEALNRRLWEQGDLRLVEGRASGLDGGPLADKLVFAFDRDNIGGAYLGSATTNADGFFRIYYDPRLYAQPGEGVLVVKEIIDLIVFAYDAAGAVLAESETVTDPPPELQVELLPRPQPPAGDALVVRGQVVTEDGNPVEGVQVTVFDRDIGPRRELLGQPARTGPDGQFEVDYYLADFAAGDSEPKSADLIFELRRGDFPLEPFQVIRRFAASNGQPAREELVADDDLPLGIAARPVEEVRLVLPAAAPPAEPSEYERLWRAIEPLLAEPAPAGADDAAREARVCRAAAVFDETEHRDISFAAREIGWERQPVEQFAAACRLAQTGFDNQLAPAVLYGLARQGLDDLRRLASAGDVQLTTALRQAVAQNIIPPLDEASLTAAVALIRQLAPRQVLAQPLSGNMATIGGVLALAIDSPEQQADLLRLGGEHQGTAAEFWQSLRQNPDFKEKAAEIQYVTQLGALTQANVPLMQQIRQAAPAAASLATLALHVDPATLTNLVAGADVPLPAGLPGNTEAEQRAFYAQGIGSLLAAAQPTAAAARTLRSLNDNAPVSPATANFLTKLVTERPEFDLLTARVADHADLLDNALNDPQKTQVLAETRRVQRLLRLSTSEQNFAGLVSGPFHSAAQITGQYTRAGFVAAAQNALGGEAEANLVYSRALAVSAATLTMAVHAYQLANDATPYAVSGGLKEMPAWAKLFGSVELCDCEQCRAWTSPAAYLVDLLLFLDQKHRPNLPQTPLDILLARRPDLAHLQLTCENTNTPLPYLDLANEVLESYIALGDKLDATTAHDVTGETAAELRAMPQHISQTAYNTLAGAVYPISLPFNRWLEMARVYLAQLNLSRPDLLAALAGAFGDSETAKRRERHSEFLSISAREHELITGQDFALADKLEPLPNLYGLAESDLYRPLQEGDAGAAVVVLQAKLVARGANLTLDGRFGPLVTQAVKDFQTDEGLPVTGAVDAATWASLKPLPPEAVAAFVGCVPEFLERTRLAFTELVELLKCRFINPGQALYDQLESIYAEFSLTSRELRAFIQANYTADPALADKLAAHGQTPADLQQAIETRLPAETIAGLIVLYSNTDDECDPAGLQVQHLDGSALGEDELRRLHTFVRLWRKLGWTMPELDRALLAFGATATITPACLEELARLEQLRQASGASVTLLLSLWQPLDTRGPNSLYEQLFQKRSVLNPPDDDLRLRDVNGQPDTAGKPIDDKIPALLAALRLRAADLTAIRQAAKLTDQQAPTSLANLSQLHRYALLARLLNLRAAEFIALKTLAGADPFANPQATLDFGRVVEQVRQSGLTTAQLTYLFAAENSLAPAPAQVAALVEQLRTGLLAIGQQQAAPETDTPDAEQAARSFIKQTLSETLGLEAATTAALLEEMKLLHSTADPAAPAITDFLLLPGLHADYFNNVDLQGDPAATQIDLDLNFDWQRDRPEPLVDADRFSVRWQGWLLATASGEHTFVAHADDGLRLRLNNQLLIDEWHDSDAAAQYTAKITLEAGRFYPLTVEYFENLFDARLNVRWTLPGAANPTSLAANLFQSQPPFFAAPAPIFTRLHKIALLATTLNLSAAELRYFCPTDDDPQQFDLNKLGQTPVPDGFARWQRLADYAALRSRLTPGDVTLLDVFTAADNQKRDTLAAATGWPATVIDEALAACELDAAALIDERPATRLERVIELSRTTGAPPAKLKAWASQPPSAQQAQEIVNTVKARYDDSAWLDVAARLNDALRERQRDALVAYVLTRPAIRRANARTANDLFEYFLIDVEMSACMATSRIKQAISSTQLFVQRVLLNRDADLPPDAIDTEQWQWRKNYRVWEANRKIFLYPENWIEPELRDNKSPFFQELESELLQGDVNSDTVERALLTYLEKLNDVARLEVCGYFWQQESNPDIDIMHVFGRTSTGSSRTYYYRRLVDGRHWTPWEPVTVDIQGVEKDDDNPHSGVHLLPVIWRGKLYLFWPQFTKKAGQSGLIGATKNMSDSISFAAPNGYWQIKLAWSRYEQGRWSPKQVSDDFVNWPRERTTPKAIKLGKGKPVPNTLDDAAGGPEQIKLRARIDGGMLRVGLDFQLLRHHLLPFELHTAEFVLADPYAAPAAWLPLSKSIRPLNAGRDQFQQQEDNGALELSSPPEAWKQIRLLNRNAADPYRLLPPANLPAEPLDQPVFFQNNAHTYFVRLEKDSYFEWPRVVEPPVKNAPRLPYLDKLTGPDLQANVAQLVPRPPQQVVDPSPWVDAAARLAPAMTMQAVNRVQSVAAPAAAMVQAVTPQVSLSASLDKTALVNAMAGPAQNSFLWGSLLLPTRKTTVNARFFTFFHPQVSAFIAGLKQRGLPGLLNLTNQGLGNPYLSRPWEISAFPMPISAQASGAASVIQGGFGEGARPGNFEALVLEGSELRLYWRDNGAFQQGSTPAWRPDVLVSSDAVAAGCMVERRRQRVTDGQGNVTRPGDFEALVPESGGKLVHYRRVNKLPLNDVWTAVGVVSSAATGPASLIERQNGELHALALEGSRISHYVLNGNSWTAQPQPVSTAATGPASLIETASGGLAAVVLEGGALVHYRQQADGAWVRQAVVTQRASGPGALIQNRIAAGEAGGDLELVAPEGAQLVHYWLAGNLPTSPWRRGQTITRRVALIDDTAADAPCLFQSSYGIGNIEVFVREPDGLKHYKHVRSDADFYFERAYQPVHERVPGLYPRHEVDFAAAGPYAGYNWELFFHAPLLLANQLSLNQRFADAQKWFHFVFDPTTNDADTDVRRFWQVLPLREVSPERLAEMFRKLQPGGSNSPAEQEVVNQLIDLAKHPFQPHLIARSRLSAYQKFVVMKYLDNLIAWGDQLFRRDTIETINEATLLYVLAARLLGPRPERIPPRRRPQPLTFAQLRPLLDEAGNAQVEAEDETPFASLAAPVEGQPEAAALLSMGRTLYFCIPQNDKLLGYWDVVEDRLFKIRHCMNIEGVVRQLPLFEPPIDPALLVRAAAAGLDIGSVLSDLSAPLPRYRFAVMLQKALEMAGELKALGSALLAALEKKDAEHLGQMRAGHESALLAAVRHVKEWQKAEAEASLNALRAQRQTAIARLLHYSQLLGEAAVTIPTEPGDPKKPDEPASTTAIQPYNPTGRFELVNGGKIVISGAAVGASAGELIAGPGGGAAGGAIGAAIGDIELASLDSGTKMLKFEQEEIFQSFLAAAFSMASSTVEGLATLLHLIPQAEISLKPLGLGGSVNFGGAQLGAATTAAAKVLGAMGTWHGFKSTLASRLAGFVWREQEQALQRNSAALEIEQIDRQIIAAKIRHQIASLELDNQDTLIANAAEVESFLQTKFTNTELYGWMERGISKLYFEAYQLAYDLAKRAERCYRFELGIDKSDFIKFGYWDSLRKGLMAGDALFLALKQLERAYHDQNRREYEITKHVSLLALNPLALIELRETGRCEFDLPEALFDLDFPGHYFRRVKSVSLTIPCVVGPYTGVSATLTLLRNSLRRDSTLAGGHYARDMANDDPRFIDDLVPTQSIATSHAQNDSGMFELNFRDERYLPFEGAGAVSRWRLDLPATFRQFDYDTIADAVLHLKYTAREGGQLLAGQALVEMSRAQDLLLQLGQTEGGLFRLVSLRQELAGWTKLLRGDKVELDLRDRFPLLLRGRKLSINQLEVFVKSKTNKIKVGNSEKPFTDWAGKLTVQLDTDSFTLQKWSKAQPGDEDLLWLRTNIDWQPDQETRSLQLSGNQFDALREAIEDVVLVCRYTVG
ncbi:MAG: hypothetical protein FOGNACKC_03476 [Anaerolineae bacterium]|nr:hypothetical protein [Anaerolineae bacterium]